MGWAFCGKDDLGRPIGYGVLATCDEPGCKTRIDRGLGYICGSMHGSHPDGCGRYFCGPHGGGLRHGCKRCSAKEAALEEKAERPSGRRRIIRASHRRRMTRRRTRRENP